MNTDQDEKGDSKDEDQELLDSLHQQDYAFLFDDDEEDEANLDENDKVVNQQIRESMPKTHVHSVKKPITE